MGFFSQSPEDEKEKFIEKARSSSEKGNYSKAIRYYNKALGIDPNDIKLFKSIAYEYFSLEDYDKVFEYSSMYLAFDSKDIEMLDVRFTAACEMKDAELIIKTGDELLSVSPDGYLRWYEKGLAHLALDDYEGAKKCGEEMNNIASDFPHAYRVLAQAEEGLGNVKGAEEYYSRAEEEQEKLSKIINRRD